MASSAEGFVKIVANLPEDEEVDSESFWAKPLGDDLYELNNVPFRAYDLHPYDVVRAVSPRPDRIPEIIEVVRRSGHKTLRVLMEEATPADEVRRLLETLNAMKASYERGSRRFYAFDVEPEADYQAVCDQLWQWEQEGLLQYETGMTEDADSDNTSGDDSSGI
ncbi:MAG TPA: DUF4265 domain-containing protein [Thermomicrobiales bacterium]|nr:DUF4265 domain-containing protein [Thermomicrobiales bacterium]